MDFSLGPELESIADEARKLAAAFDDDYWSDHDQRHAFFAQSGRAHLGCWPLVRPARADRAACSGSDRDGRRQLRRADHLSGVVGADANGRFGALRRAGARLRAATRLL